MPLQNPGQPSSSCAPIWPDPKGITILLMGEDPEDRFEQNLTEARALTASWIQICFPTFQRNFRSSTFPIPDRRSPAPAQLEKAITSAKRAGFKISLHPILLIQDPQDPHWRGQLDPWRKKEWFSSYRRWMKKLSRMAHRNEVDLLVIGSELSSLQDERDEWLRVIELVRSQYLGPITYSANWDRCLQISFASKLDALGINSYVPFPRQSSQSDEQLVGNLLPFRSKIYRWSIETGTPVFFSEVGYPSHNRGLEKPWDQYCGDSVDLESQERGYQAFLSTFMNDREVRGVFFYALHTDGGMADSGYTPVGKPAAGLVRNYFKMAQRNESKRHHQP